MTGEIRWPSLQCSLCGNYILCPTNGSMDIHQRLNCTKRKMSDKEYQRKHEIRNNNVIAWLDNKIDAWDIGIQMRVSRGELIEDRRDEIIYSGDSLP